MYANTFLSFTGCIGNNFFFLSLQIFSNLSLNERCLSVSLVCKYWRDLCLDFQFWKQLDLSSRQQVWRYHCGVIVFMTQNLFLELVLLTRGKQKKHKLVIPVASRIFLLLTENAWSLRLVSLNIVYFVWDQLLNSVSTSTIWNGLSVSVLQSGTIGPLINSKTNMSISEDAVVGRMVTCVVLALSVLINFLYFILQLVWLLLIRKETVWFWFFLGWS